MANLPKDENGNPIPALSLLDGAAQKVNIGPTANRSTPITGDNEDRVYGGKVIALFADTNCYIKFGGSDVVATTNDHFFPNGLYYDFALKKSETHISVISDELTGTLHISPKD